MDDKDSHKSDMSASQYERRQTEEADRQARIEYLRSITPKAKQKPAWLRVVWIVLLVLIVLALAGAAYWQYTKSANKKRAHQASQMRVHKSTTPVKPATKRYESTTFSLSFSYPENWQVTEPAGSNQIVARSPAMQLTNASGKTITGQAVLTISQKGQNLSVFDAGNALAVRESEKIAYTKPTGSQHASTYISFLQYHTTTTKGALDSIAITGNYGYQKDQAIPKVDMAKVDPLIMVTFVKCADKACSGATTATSIPASAWSNAQFAEPIQTMLKSFEIN